MSKSNTRPSGLLSLLLLLALPAEVEAQFAYGVTNGAITILGYTGPAGAVVIPPAVNGLPVVGIGASAFWDCSSLISVTIPDSVTNIGYEAFYACGSLTNVTIGNGVISIGDYAFNSCGRLTSITIGTNVTGIGAYAFSGTVGGFGYYPSGDPVSSVNIPNSVTNIGNYAFYDCSNLTNVTIANGVISIGDDAFALCSLASVTIPNTVTNIGGGAFASCNSLTSVTVGTGAATIGEGAFSQSTSLASIYFQGNAPSADPSVFVGDNYCTVYYLPGTTAGGRSLPTGRPCCGTRRCRLAT